MTPDPTDFEQYDSERLVRDVKTPMPENEDGSGYTTEENRQWLYVDGDTLVKVSKVSDRGWTVTAYTQEDGSVELDDILGQEMNAQEAHRLAGRAA